MLPLVRFLFSSLEIFKLFHQKMVLGVLAFLLASQSLNGDILSLNFYDYGALNSSDYHKVTLEANETAGYGNLNTGSWRNIRVPWGLTKPQNNTNVATRDGVIARFRFNDVRNGGPYRYQAPHDNLQGNGNGDMMDGHFNGTEYPGNGSLEGEFVISSIPFASYDVVVYLGANEGQYNQGEGYIVLNDGPVQNFKLPPGQFTSFTQIFNDTNPGNFIAYKGLTDPLLKVRIAGYGETHIGATGIQIVESGVINFAIPPGLASSPVPADGAAGLPFNTDLSWDGGHSRTTSKVYFGTSPNLGASDFKGNRSGTSYDPGTLAAGTYYWRIDEANSDGTTTGTVWSMSVGSPGKASLPMPYDGMRAVKSGATLSWNTAELTDSFNVYLGTSPSGGSFQGNQTGTRFQLGDLLPDTTYYWRVDPINAQGTTRGDVWSFSTPKASGGKVKVFILAGQSNMQGQGEISREGKGGTLEYLVENEPATYAHFKDGDDWTVRDDVWVWYKRSEGELKKGDLAPGYGPRDHIIGAELQFGHLMGNEFGEQVLIIKTAWGGKSLNIDFRPPSKGWGDGMPQSEGDDGYYYHRMMNHVVDVMNNLGSYFPDYADQGFEVLGFGWHQGWNDYIESSFVANYEANMETFIKDVRSSLGVPDLPFVIASTGQIQGSSISALELAQLEMANASTYPAFDGNVAAIDTRAQGYYQPIEDSPADQGFHWNRSAKSFYLLGDGIGTEMLDLLDTYYVDTIAPSLASITDNISGTTINGLQTITYTVTFDEAIDASTVNASDFQLSGTAAATIDSVSATSDTAAFEIAVTPSSGGSLQLVFKSGATVTDTSGNLLNSSSAILDDKVFTIISDTTPPSVSSIADNVTGTDIQGLQDVIYTITFSEAIDSGTVSAADFALSGTASASVTNVSATGDSAVYMLTVSPSSGGSLRLSIKSGATIKDLAGNSLNTSSAIFDSETFAIIVDTTPPTVSSITDNISGTDIMGLQDITYTISFNEAINSATVSASDFALSGTASAAIANVSASANPAVYTITVTPSSAGSLRFSIKSGASITDVFGNALITSAAILDDKLFAISTNYPSFTLNTGGSDSWNNASNWDTNSVPTGNADVTINSGVAASAYNAATPTWNGTLVLQDSSSLEIEDTTGSENALHGATVLNMTNATIFAEAKVALDFPALSLTGANTITSMETSAHSRIRNFNNSITNTGSLTISGVNKQLFYFTASNSLSGGFNIAAQDRYEVFFNAAGSAGSGKLKVTPRSADGRSAVVFINASGALANVTSLALNGSGWDNSSGGNHAGTNYKIVMNANDTVEALSVDSAAQNAGTYGKIGHGGVDNEVTWISGNSILTVNTSDGAESAYDSWTSNFSGLTNDDVTLDYDNGGLSTALEWVLGGDPTDSNDDHSIEPTLEMQSGNYRFIYRRSDLAHADSNTAITVEYSDDLANWTTATHGGLITITEDDDHYGAGYDRVIVTISPNIVTDGKLYTRLKVIVAE